METDELAGWQPLPRSFFAPSARKVAPRLLGHWLLRRTEDGFVGGRIVETEAYLRGDPACHAFSGPSARNRAMWGEPGRAYVYLIYGFYYCFNAVCLPAGEAEAVLVRAIDVVHGREEMLRARPVRRDVDLTSGPGKLCVALQIDRTLDGADLCDPASPVIIAVNPSVTAFRRRFGPVVTTTRIGLTQAADWPLRYYLEKSSFVSRKVKERPPD